MRVDLSNDENDIVYTYVRLTSRYLYACMYVYVPTSVGTYSVVLIYSC